ncbi:hypothetical protein L1987_72676 [Smallanthus sonchifolius]|uniref:Uncharacterized protein n=1 Tax=Smallanthus sonchifolius TaxID=185202 RepID=A0ACB9AX75_9ASTR|nr:hypothetical protein L1987_72676 [Smallanthus sonchifolius]
MAKPRHPIMALILLLHVLVTIAVAGHDIPNTSLEKHDDIKHPESFINHDRGYLVPGVGRGIKPKFKHGFNPFTYNPVTGGNDGGIGGHLTRFGRVGGGSFMPGGDDTFVPNPGFGVPRPGTGSTAPGPIKIIEFTQSRVSDNVLLNSDLSGFSGQVMMLDAKKDLVSRILEVQLRLGRSKNSGSSFVGVGPDGMGSLKSVDGPSKLSFSVVWFEEMSSSLLISSCWWAYQVCWADSLWTWGFFIVLGLRLIGLL